jgi:hypothetical protein
MPIYASKFVGAGTVADPKLPEAALGMKTFRTAVIGSTAISNVPVQQQLLPAPDPGGQAAPSTVVYLGETLDSPMSATAVKDLRTKHNIIATAGETPRQMGARLGVQLGSGN